MEKNFFVSHHSSDLNIFINSFFSCENLNCGNMQKLFAVLQAFFSLMFIVLASNTGPRFRHRGVTISSNMPPPPPPHPQKIVAFSIPWPTVIILSRLVTFFSISEKIHVRCASLGGIQFSALVHYCDSVYSNYQTWRLPCTIGCPPVSRLKWAKKHDFC